jgi:Zn-dependent peptidase ImmA (M78 family)/DNA-binding XRE family transcriptional regulator
VSVGLRIAQRRKELGFNQTELSQKAGLKPAAINQYESGERRPSFEALIKLAGALKVSTDYLIGSGIIDTNLLNDPTVKVLLKTIESLSDENKTDLLKYAYFLLNQPLEPKYPIFNDVFEYSEYILRETSQEDLPINLNSIADRLNIKIIETSNIRYEGVLIKQSDNSVILLDNMVPDEERPRFTIAHLLGHYVIPWHNKSSFYCREKGTSTLQTEDPIEIEANEFAAALLMPEYHLKRDIIGKRIPFDQLEDIAINKYHVSLFAMANRLVQYMPDEYALINSKDNLIIKRWPGNHPLTDELHSETLAAQLFNDLPKEKTIRSGYVLAGYWLNDAKPNDEVYEESIYNPTYNGILTLLSFPQKR